MLTLATDRVAFAAERKPLLKRGEDRLLGSVKSALRRHGQEGWYESLIRRTLTLMRVTYYSESGHRSSNEMRVAVKELEKELRASLKKTKKPSDVTSLNNAARAIAASLSTAAINGGLLAAAKADEESESMVKVWITMHDDKVRHAHADTDGQAVGLSENFEVSGVRMFGPGDMTAPIELWINCRCILGIDKAQAEDEALTAAGKDVEMAEDDIKIEEDAAVEMPLPTDDTIPWHGVLAPEDTLSGDGRKFTSGALRWRDLPLPLAWQKTSLAGHDGSVVVGRIDEIWRDGKLMRAKGTMLNTPEADEVIGIMAEGGLRGVSVDVDDATMTLEDEDGNQLDMADGVDPHSEIMAFTDGRICGATLCAIPAFSEAMVFLGLGDEERVDPPEVAEEVDAEGNPTDSEIDQLSTGTEEFAPGTQDGPGWLTHPVDTDRLRDYWTKGPGAAKIGWGAGGDFNRCRTLLAEYVKPQHLSGYCANRHKDALGIWPGEHLGGKTLTAAATAPSVRLHSLTAAGLMKPPREWFEDPQLVGQSPIVVTEDGRVFGHLAAWGECHIGFGEAACTTAPPSMTDYAYFKTGAVLTDEGEVAVGQITLGTGHAGPNASARKAMAHYDNTGSVAADVNVGDDEFGVWVAGAVRPGTKPEDIYALRAAALSGDWRAIGGNLELVAALAVNVPGFPIPRTQIAASGGRQTALVASGIVEQPKTPEAAADIDQIVAAAIDNYIARQAAKVKMDEFKQRLGRDPKSRMKALAAKTGRN